ncbi:hypothetical protein J6590_055432 [Homalodisca vitripennis]|nr:hypothetical protein J6590_055432 [Homalodisca vitripennis]
MHEMFTRGIVRVGLELTSHSCYDASATNGRCPKLVFRMAHLFSEHGPTFHRGPSVIDGCFDIRSNTFI